MSLRTWLLFVVFSTFHIKVQLFCFLLKQFFENVKKKVYGQGALERVGRVTVNTTFFFFASKRFFWNLQETTEVTRCSCWHQNFVPKGLSVPALGLYTCIKSWKKLYKIRLQRIFFLTCSKWPKWQEVSVDIKILSPGFVCPWPAAIYRRLPLCRLRVTRYYHLCQSDFSFPTLFLYISMHFNSVYVENGKHEATGISRWFFMP